MALLKMKFNKLYIWIEKLFFQNFLCRRHVSIDSSSQSSFLILCPLILVTFSWGQKRCHYFEKCHYFGKWRISHLRYRSGVAPVYDSHSILGLFDNFICTKILWPWWGSFSNSLSSFSCLFIWRHYVYLSRAGLRTVMAWLPYPNAS